MSLTLRIQQQNALELNLYQLKSENTQQFAFCFFSRKLADGFQLHNKQSPALARDLFGIASRISAETDHLHFLGGFQPIRRTIPLCPSPPDSTQNPFSRSPVSASNSSPNACGYSRSRLRPWFCQGSRRQYVSGLKQNRFRHGRLALL